MPAALPGKQGSRPWPAATAGFFFRRRACWVPTWRGGLAVLLALALTVARLARHIHAVLAVTDSRPGGVLVVEGWAPDDVLQAAIAECQRHSYQRLFVTGGPIEKGAPLVEYRTVAEFTAATLLKLGMAANMVQAVPAPETRQDRTYAAALALQRWLLAQGGLPARCNIVTVGAHARRTRLLYAKVFGPAVSLGIIAVPDRNYDADHWWRSSAGVRTVLSESIAYGYARFVFRPPSV
ncbi:MAG: YdcF family protein [Kiritimatiellaeota bacterium]|nr:YdcF family protein [Kiritimatiellota bacterium]